MRDTMLIIDDLEMSRELLHQYFEEEYKIVEASNGKEGIAYIEEHIDEIILIFLDVHMPVMDGYEFMEFAKEREWPKKIPVMFITDDSERGVLKRGYELGVMDVIRKPFDIDIIRNRVKNVLELYEHKNYLEAEVAKQTKELSIQYNRLKEHNEHLIDILNDIITYRNTESQQHIQAVQGYTKILAEKYAQLYPRAKMTRKKIDMIVEAARMHDVGKIVMKDSLLKRQGKLSDEEKKVMEAHTIKGGEIVKVMFEFRADEYRKICYNICRYHHEKYDGSGYPDQMKNEKIPIEAQIVGLADMYDTLVNVAIHNMVYSSKEIFYMLMNGEFGEMSPRIKECLEAAWEELEQFRVKNDFESGRIAENAG